MNTVKEMVKGKKVNFIHYSNNELWYKTECGFEFPVPVNDVGTASMNATDNALYFMRWINKQIVVVKEYEQLKIETEVGKQIEFDNFLAPVV